MNHGISPNWELVKDREAWRDSVHGVTESQTRLSDSAERMTSHVIHCDSQIQIPAGAWADNLIAGNILDLRNTCILNLKNFLHLSKEVYNFL